MIPSKSFVGRSVAAISDALDAMGRWDQTLSPRLKMLSRPKGQRSFAGPAKTIQYRARPPAERAQHDTDSQLLFLKRMQAYVTAGDVLVVGFDGEPPACETIGGLMARWYQNIGVAGFVTDAYMRDRGELAELGFPVVAAGTALAHIRGRVYPGSWGEPIVVGGVRIRPGDHVVGDADGTAIIPQEEDIASGVLERVLKMAEFEQKTAAALRAGEPMPDVFAKYRHL